MEGIEEQCSMDVMNEKEKMIMAVNQRNGWKRKTRKKEGKEEKVKGFALKKRRRIERKMKKNWKDKEKKEVKRRRAKDRKEGRN